jgi:hypothetical protein
MLNLNNPIDVNYFNMLVNKGGGIPLITGKKILSLKAFITVLLKIFKKDYNLRLKIKRKGGYYDSLGLYSSSLNYSDLNYSNEYQFPLINFSEREYI